MPAHGDADRFHLAAESGPSTRPDILLERVQMNLEGRIFRAVHLNTPRVQRAIITVDVLVAAFLLYRALNKSESVLCSVFLAQCIKMLFLS